MKKDLKLPKLSVNDLGELANFTLGVKFKHIVPLYPPYSDNPTKSNTYNFMINLNPVDLTEMVKCSNSLAKLEGLGDNFYTIYEDDKVDYRKYFKK